MGVVTPYLRRCFDGEFRFRELRPEDMAEAGYILIRKDQLWAAVVRKDQDLSKAIKAFDSEDNIMVIYVEL